MKTCTATIATTLFAALLGCAQAATPPVTAKPAAPKPAAAASAGKLCKLTIAGNEMLQYDKKELAITADCARVELTLTYGGKMPVQAMGHNWVLTKTADAQIVANLGIAAGFNSNHVPVGDKRIIAATKLIGGGQTTSVTFSTQGLQKGGDYTYFCSFPGHFAIMKGKFIIR